MALRQLAPADIKLEGIGHVLRDRRLTVPPYQRGYSWQKEEFGDFWWDLRAAFETPNPQYFLGTIVLTGESGGGIRSIIDGQQRLTTTSLLLIALRNEFARRGDTDRAQVIERDYGTTLELRSGKRVTRLTLGGHDLAAYESLLKAPSHPEDESAAPTDLPQSRLSEALVFLEEQVRNEAKNAGLNWAERLFRWVEFLEYQARVITVTVADESDAFMIFETLNDRGRELTVADLLKNYLFGASGTSLSRLQSVWASAVRALETSANEEIFTTFLRHLWTSLHGATRERELYSRIKAVITSKKSAELFGDDIEAAAPKYAALLNADQPFWTANAALRPAAETLLRLGLEQNRPLLLAAMRNFSVAELGRLMNSLIGWSVRGLLVGGIGGGTTEKAFAEAAVSISGKRARDTNSVFELLSEVVPTDESFGQAFQVRRVSRTTISKYLLVALSRSERGIVDPQLVTNSVDAQYRLATKLPKGADPSLWPLFAADELSDWVYRLGNLYVVPVDNSNEPVSPAGEALATESTQWSPTEINVRQINLSVHAVGLWPRRPT